MPGRGLDGVATTLSPPSEVSVVTLAPGMESLALIAELGCTIPPGFGTRCLSCTNIKINSSQQIFIEGFQNNRDHQKGGGDMYTEKYEKWLPGLKLRWRLLIIYINKYISYIFICFKNIIFKIYLIRKNI